MLPIRIIYLWGIMLVLFFISIRFSELINLVKPFAKPYLLEVMGMRTECFEVFVDVDY